MTCAVSRTPRATTPDAAEAIAPAYYAAVERAAAERVVLSGYRLADLLAHIVT